MSAGEFALICTILALSEWAWIIGGELHMSKKWWKCAGIRALKTCAQTAIATIGTTALITDVNWAVVVSASALAGVLSLLTSLAGLPEIDG